MQPIRLYSDSPAAEEADLRAQAEALKAQAEAMQAQAAAMLGRAQAIRDAGLPAGTPLLAKAEEAAALFGVSPRTLYNIAAANREMDALTVRVGRAVLYDIPRLYAWFGQRLGTEIRTQ